MNRAEMTDVCILLEGTYPFVAGGVSSWVHDLIRTQKETSFQLLTLVPDAGPHPHRYDLPDNVRELNTVVLRRLPRGKSSIKKLDRLMADLEEPLLRLHNRGGLEDLARILDLVSPRREELGREALLNSPQAWELLLRMYRRSLSHMPFLDYFWSWRALMSGLFSMLLAELPPARIYHTISTGYAGLLAARAHLETGRPVLLTEHGIYTNERRIDIAMSDWPYESPFDGYQIGSDRRDLKRLWIDSFVGYSMACYQASSRIITLYAGNQQSQLDDGADPSRMCIIPNGIDYPRFSAIVRDPRPHPPTVALIGRVVPIKDVKTFIRACGNLRERVPDLRALIMGPTEEEVDYFQECLALTESLGLADTVVFTGKVKLDDYLGQIDVIALTSLSEAQPLVILEAGASGIPSVATNVGACPELILGRPDENPPLGPSGIVTPLANPLATSDALARLLNDPDWYRKCGQAIRERVRRYYNKVDLDQAYRNQYREYFDVADRVMQMEKVS
jgi:polysaccharide biosynthesis protein PelF